MTQDAITKIMAAEEQASVLCRVATERADEMCAEMERAAKEQLAEVERETQAEYDLMLEKIRKGAEGLLSKKRDEAKAEAEALVLRAKENVQKATELIVWGMVEKCQ